MSEIKVLSSLATKEAYLELVPQFETATGHKIATTWAGTVDIMKRMGAGEVYDLLVASSSAIDELIKLGKVAAGGDKKVIDLAGIHPLHDVHGARPGGRDLVPRRRLELWDQFKVGLLGGER